MTAAAARFQPDANRYYAEGYWRGGDLWEDVAARAHEHPDRRALVLDDRHVTYAGLRKAAIGVSRRLAEAGIEPGDVVVLLGRHSIEAAVSLLGCLHRGVVLAPLPPMFNVTQLSALLEQTSARVLIAFGGEKEVGKCREVEDQVELLLEVKPEDVDAWASGMEPPDERVARDPDDLALVLHSSGTTSAPKGVAHSTNTLRYATEGLGRRWGLTGDDIYLTVVEFGFVGGLVFGYLPVLLNGATGVLLNRWNADDALRLIEEHGCTYVLAMPTHANDMINAAEATERDLSSMRILAGPGLTPERRVRMKAAFGVPPLGDYGLSEVPGHAAHAPDDPEEKILRTEGRPYDGTEIRIVDEKTEEPVPAGTVGAVIVNGPSRFLGFFKNDDLTRESLTDWGGYRTGDLGMLDTEGHFVYVGRSKDIIRRGGVTIVPAEVEPVISRHPAVHEVAIVPIPDDRLGERACAALIARPGFTAPTLKELQAFLDAEGVAKYTWPESVEVFDQFPRTPSLKVVKRDLVQAILERTRVTT
jgi:acyl-CoA synthetase (AMP-forming)/AMP-acid ligase II